MHRVNGRSDIARSAAVGSGADRRRYARRVNTLLSSNKSSFCSTAAAVLRPVIIARIDDLAQMPVAGAISSIHHNAVGAWTRRKIVG